MAIDIKNKYYLLLMQLYRFQQARKGQRKEDSTWPLKPSIMITILKTNHNPFNCVNTFYEGKNCCINPEIRSMLNVIRKVAKLVIIAVTIKGLLVLGSVISGIAQSA
jgi:hypothetical protein